MFSIPNQAEGMRHHDPEDHKPHGEDAEQPGAAQSPPSGIATSTGLGAERLAAAMAHQQQLQREVQSLTAQMQQVGADHTAWLVWVLVFMAGRTCTC